VTGTMGARTSKILKVTQVCISTEEKIIVSNEHIWKLIEENYQREFKKAVAAVENLLLKLWLSCHIGYDYVDEGICFRIDGRDRKRFHKDLKAFLESRGFVNVQVCTHSKDEMRFLYQVDVVDPKKIDNELPAYTS
jgi:nicotinamide riboside kinase